MSLDSKLIRLFGIQGGILKTSFVCVVVLVLAFSALSQRRGARSPISEDALRAHIKFLADNLLEGRGTGARGGELAANYTVGKIPPATNFPAKLFVFLGDFG